MGEAPEDPEIIAAKLAMGGLTAKAMTGHAEQELAGSPGDSAWLEVLLIEGDRATDFEPAFKTALVAHGIEVPEREVAVERIARHYAQEAIGRGLRPVDAAELVVSQFSFGDGPALPRHVYELECLLAIHDGSEPINQQEYVDEMREQLRRLAAGEPSSAR